MSLLRLKSSVVLAISALVGLILSVTLLFIVQRQAAIDSVDVVIATRSIAKGTVLTESMVERVAWPANLKSFSALQSVDEASGRVARKDILDGEPIQDSGLWPRGQSGDINDQLQIGDRAISIRINDLIGISAEDLVGQFVDLVGTSRPDDGQPITESVVERVKVLAVARTSGQSEGVIRGITVSVSPEQVTRIEKARLRGTITALIRNPRDLVSSRDPIREEMPPRVLVKPTSNDEIELILGGRRLSNGATGIGTSQTE